MIWYDIISCNILYNTTSHNMITLHYYTIYIYIYIYTLFTCGGWCGARCGTSCDAACCVDVVLRRWRAAVRSGAVRCGAVRRGAVRCGAVRCGAVRGGAVRCGAVRCGAARCGAVRCGAVRDGTLRAVSRSAQAGRGARVRVCGAAPVVLCPMHPHTAQGPVTDCLRTVFHAVVQGSIEPEHHGHPEPVVQRPLFAVSLRRGIHVS